MTLKKGLTLLVLAGQLAAACAAPDNLSAPVKSWLAAQSQIRGWTADLTQTRTLQSLLEPLTAKGHIWFEAPGRFRWELGQPARTIAISTSTNLSIIYPRLKRVEVIALGPEQTGPWRAALDMLEAGFPRTEAELLDRYHVLAQDATNQICKLRLQPRVESFRKMMPQLEIDFDTKDFLLRGTELQFADGSTMRNDFTGIVLNPKFDDSIFSPTISSDYTVVHPQAQR
jgi:outer membrane lipoprotein-sorting protein